MVFQLLNDIGLKWYSNYKAILGMNDIGLMMLIGVNWDDTICDL